MIRRATLRIFEDELRVLVSEIRRFPAIETGGVLFGTWSHGGQPTVWLATRPGPAAIRRYTSFTDDSEAYMRLERDLWERYGVQCIGLWHSHHRLGMPVLSAGDVHRTRTYAQHTGRERFAEILGYYRDDDQIGLKPWVYPRASEGRCVASQLEVLPGGSPLRAALGRAPLPFLGDALAPASPRLRTGWVLEHSDPGWHQPGEDDGAPLDPHLGARLVEAVERLVVERVPERWLPHIALFTTEDGHAILEVGHNPDTTKLRVLFGWQDRLQVLRWEVSREAPLPPRVVASAEPAPGRRKDVESLLAGGLASLEDLTHRSNDGLGATPAVPPGDGA